MDMEDDMEEMPEESVEYDLDEAQDEDDVVEEATKLSDNVAEPKGGEADKKESPLTSAPKKNFKDHYTLKYRYIYTSYEKHV